MAVLLFTCVIAVLRNPVHYELCKCDYKKAQQKLGQKVRLDHLVHPLLKAGKTSKLAPVAGGFAQLNYEKLQGLRFNGLPGFCPSP